MCVQSGYHKVVLLLHQAREWYEGVGINPGVGPRIFVGRDTDKDTSRGGALEHLALLPGEEQRSSTGIPGT